jgi:urease accessory protein
MPEDGFPLADLPSVDPVPRRAFGHAGHAGLDIGLSPDGLSFVRRQDVRYPFHVCRPFRYDGDPRPMVTIYLQSCAGGIFDGDSLTQRISVEDGAMAHVTTQASTIIHETPDHGASQIARLTAGQGTILEYLPDPLILFPRARFQSRLEVELDPTAIAILSDSFIWHDPAGAQRSFDNLQCETKISITGMGLVALDRYDVTGRELQRGMVGANGAYTAQGSIMILTGKTATGELLEALQQALAEESDTYAMASRLPRGVGYWARILARDAVALRRVQQSVWSVARLMLTGIRPVSRRK